MDLNPDFVLFCDIDGNCKIRLDVQLYDLEEDVQVLT